ncbi:MAG: anti-sigma F factor [Lachnospiraceae bacterium]|nr:anti-sigma F factor [Lachnospiraceae bacterium]
MNLGKKEIRLEFDAISENEALARVVIAAFLTQLDPTLEELQDVKTAVSEAVTNAIIHAYQEKGGKIVMGAALTDDELLVSIEDFGVGIENIQRAMEPLFTTSPETERAGMGFAFMEAFMDKLEVESVVGVGTKVCMRKKFYPAKVWKDSQV